MSRHCSIADGARHRRRCVGARADAHRLRRPRRRQRRQRRRGGGAASPGITDTTLTLGITTPLSGATAGPGTCTVAGVKAYFGAKNAEGGIKFGDGKTRNVDDQGAGRRLRPAEGARRTTTSSRATSSR